MKTLLDIVARHKRGEQAGVYSLCSAHPRVIESAMREASACDAPLLVEATSNQVNQFGGYTGMTPADFRSLRAGDRAPVWFSRTAVVAGGRSPRSQCLAA